MTSGIFWEIQTTEIDVELCQGESIVIDGVEIFEEGMYTVEEISSQATIDSTLALRCIEEAIDEHRCARSEGKNPVSLGLARDCHRRLIDMRILSSRDSITLAE